MEPSVSVPIATCASDAASAAAEPEDEPQGLRSRTYGLFVWPPTADHPDVGFAARKLAHSDRLALPRITAPAARSFFTRSASAAGGRPASARDPAVVGMSRVFTLSLSRTGMPSSGPRDLPRRCLRSLATAWPRAVGLVRSTALIFGSTALIRRR